MSSSPELEAFEVTEEDLFNEFNPSRKRFRQSKHQATYGIWADQDSDDERPSFGGKGGKASKDYTMPVNFISGGIKGGDKVTKDDEEDAAFSDSDEEPERPQLTLGGQQGSGRFRGSAYVKLQAQRAARGPGPHEEGFGDWEKHTRGIGQKLLEKMGHVAGRGLGKNLQGISTPVEAYKRKGKAAIGFYGRERTERSLKDFPVKDKEEDEEQEFLTKLQQWKKGEGEKKKKPKYVYRTADELIATGPESKKKKVPTATLR